MYFCEKYYNYCYGILANNTNAIKLFELVKYDNGLLIKYPTKETPIEYT